ncbi:MAG TPA: LysR substrate-binding domain-containing protein [Rhizobiaceae bacterium]|nr:LysR substrate-binding domain-containing protein [Rhizobiaceae bacterium]
MTAGRQASRHIIELRHLRYFLAVAEELNFGRAAERLGIAQPNLSQQIKSLEEIVGALLFDRTQRSVRLTAAGLQFLPEARESLAHAERGLVVARRAGRGEIGRIAVGYVGSATYTGVLVSIMRQFRDAFPDVEIELAEMEMQDQIANIATGILDIGFIRPPIELPLGVSSIAIMQEEVVIALPTRHQAAERDTVPLAILKDETFITPRHATNVSFTKHTRDACSAAGFEPKLGPQAAHFVTIVSMVAIGLGVALVPQSCRCLDLPGVCYRPLAGNDVKADLAVAYRRSDPSPISRTFLQYCLKFRSAVLQGRSGEIDVTLSG